MNHEINEFDGLRAFLTGLGRNNRDALVSISEYIGWPSLATQEFDRRAAALLAGLTDVEIVAIAWRKISLRELAQQVLAEIDKE